MNVKLRVLFTTLIAVVVVSAAVSLSAAQNPDMPRFRWENFTTANGLPDNHIFCVLVDGNRNRLAAPEPVELGTSMVEFGDVRLVHHEDDRGLQVAEPCGNLHVKGHHLVADIDDEQNQVGLVHRRLDLTLNVLAQIVAVDHSDSAGVEELDEPRIVVLAKLNE